MLLLMVLLFCYVNRSCWASTENNSLYKAGNMYCGCSCLNVLNESMCIIESSLKDWLEEMVLKNVMILIVLPRRRRIWKWFWGFWNSSSSFPNFSNNELSSNTYLKVGILLSKVSNTVTSPFNGAWFESSSCLIADMLMLKSLKISVLPRTPVRSETTF